MKADEFPVARYRLECVAETPHRLPFYSGSMLRGVFGRALRRTACMTGQRDCSGCPLVATCPYTQVFEPTAAPDAPRHATLVPYIVEPPPPGRAVVEAGEHFQFHMVLFGAALGQLPLVIFAWQRALAHGVGRQRSQSELLRVVLEDPADGDLTVYGGGQSRVLEHAQSIRIPSALPATDWLRLTFTTPTRLQRRGELVRPSGFRARDLFESLARRIRRAGQSVGMSDDELPDPHEIGQAADELTVEHALSWVDWQRWSSRQRQEMHLGGLGGDCMLRGELAPFMELLYLGQWLHLGKNTTFGMGRYEIMSEAPDVRPGRVVRDVASLSVDAL